MVSRIWRFCQLGSNASEGVGKRFPGFNMECTHAQSIVCHDFDPAPTRAAPPWPAVPGFPGRNPEKIERPKS